MAFNINDFKARGLFEQGARPSLFAIQLVLGDIGAPIVATEYRNAEFLVSAASLPASTVDPIEVPYFGRRVKVFGERTFGNWNVTVLNDENFALRNTFETWSNYMNQMVANLYQGDDLSDYKANGVRVIQYGKQGDILRTVRFNGLWPIQVGEIQLDWGRNNAVETFDVTFALDYWVPDGTDVNNATATAIYNTGEGVSVAAPAGGTPTV